MENQCYTYFIKIKGIVQGVGFRPTVYRIAKGLNLKGKVLNSSSGVQIYLNANEDKIKNFLALLAKSKPPPAKITTITKEKLPYEHFDNFSIVNSQEKQGEFTLISPDLATCDKCIEELFDPSDRRHLYPFINCTHCGPRFSIIKEIPYDRPLTTMNKFTMCDECQTEYEAPIDRRFHAQPNACNICGPEYQMNGKINREAIKEAILLLKEGKILAIKGISGFHIACDAFNLDTLKRLRKIKERPQKPLALMMPDIATVETSCHLSNAEKTWLESPQTPILLLTEKDTSTIPQEIAPGLNTIGVMLPYTPIHHLILTLGDFDALVMTSGNRKSNPLCRTTAEVEEQLGGIVDAILDNNRLIYNRTDDSVGLVRKGKLQLLRRARGFTPQSFKLPRGKDPMIGFGADLKGGFTLTRDNMAFKSQYISPMESARSIEFFRETLTRFLNWLDIQPTYGIIDLHPNYNASKIAEQFDLLKTKRLQHHYAHILSVLLEHNLADEPVIGLSFDGTGYGTDGAVWGSEFMISDYHAFKRVGHIKYYQLLGGDNAAIYPTFPAISLLFETFGDKFKELKLPIIDKQKKKLNNYEQLLSNQAFLSTDSMGRLFDAVAALIDICDHNTFEAEAPMKLEALADYAIKEYYHYNILADNECCLIDLEPIIKSIVDDINGHVENKVISAKFHNTIVESSFAVIGKISEEYGINTVILSGGVWQNRYLLSKMLTKLQETGYEVFTNELIPANDEGISFGQVAWGVYNF